MYPGPHWPPSPGPSYGCPHHREVTTWMSGSCPGQGRREAAASGPSPPQAAVLLRAKMNAPLGPVSLPQPPSQPRRLQPVPPISSSRSSTTGRIQPRLCPAVRLPLRPQCLCTGKLCCKVGSLPQLRPAPVPSRSTELAPAPPHCSATPWGTWPMEPWRQRGRLLAHRAQPGLERLSRLTAKPRSLSLWRQ